jgi:hypothetical protein
MSLQDRIFLDFREAVETFLRMGFEFTSNKELVRNDLQVVVRPIGNNIWRSSVERLECRPVQNRHLSPAPVDNAVEVSTQKADTQ